MNRFSLSMALLVVAAALLAACGAPSTDSSAATSGDATLGGGMPLPAAHAAVQALAEARGLAAADIAIVSAEAVEWPDACLGVEQPDQMCADVITPGYRVILQAGGEQVTFHTDEFGAALVLVQ